MKQRPPNKNYRSGENTRSEKTIHFETTARSGQALPSNESGSAGGYAPSGKSIWSRNLIVITLSNFMLFLGFEMLVVTLPVYIAECGGSDAEVGLSVGVFTFSALLMRAVSGWMLDHFGRRIVFSAGLVVMILIALLYGAVVSVGLIIAVRILHAVGWGMSSTASNTIAADSLPPARFAEGMGYFALSNSLGMAAGPALGLMILARTGFHGMFAFAAATAGVALILTFFMTMRSARDLQTARNTQNVVEAAEPAGRDSLAARNTENVSEPARPAGQDSLTSKTVNGHTEPAESADRDPLAARNTENVSEPARPAGQDSLTSKTMNGHTELAEFADQDPLAARNTENVSEPARPAGQDSLTSKTVNGHTEPTKPADRDPLAAPNTHNVVEPAEPAGRDYQSTQMLQGHSGPSRPAGPFHSMINRDALFPAITILLISTSYGALTGFVALYGAERNIGNSGIYFAVYAISMLLTRPVAGKLTDQRGTAFVVWPGMLLTFLGMICLGAAHGLPLFLISAVMYGTGMGICMSSLEALAVASVPAERRGSATATFMIGFDGGIGIGSVIAGLLASAAGYGAMYMIISIFIVFSGIWFFTGLRGSNKKQAEDFLK